MPKKLNAQPEQSPPKLVVSREHAAEKIGERIQKGKELHGQQVNSFEHLETVRNDYYTWSDYNKDLLNSFFTNDSIAKEYEGFFFSVIGSGAPIFSEEVNDFRRDVQAKVRRLESILSRLEIFVVQVAFSENKNHQSNKKVFVVHGHDMLTLANIESLILRVGCKPIIFSKISNRGSKTNIEILEANLPDSDAVIVLLTPDDEGRKVGDEKLELRARQNVLIEAGYALISRRATSLIVATGGVTIPSDFDGVNRTQAATLDKSAQIQIAQELSHILDIPIDIMHL